MAKFDKIHTGELEDWLFHSYVHDSEIMKIESNCDTGDLRVMLYNPIFHVRTDLAFHGVEAVFARKGEWPGSRRTVISLSVQENSQYLQKVLQIQNCFFENIASTFCYRRCNLDRPICGS